MIRSLLSLFLGLCPAFLFAQSSPSKEEIAKAYRDGSSALKRGDYKRSIRSFQGALLLIQQAKENSPPKDLPAWKSSQMAFLLLLGRAFERDQQPIEAWKSYFRCLLLQANPTLTEQSRQALQALEEKGTRLTVPFRLQTHPPQADVLISDAQGRKIQGQTPLALSLTPGPIEIRLTRSGYRPLSLRLDLPWDSPFEKTVSLQRLSSPQRRPPPPPPPPRRVFLPPPPPPKSGPSARDIAFPILASLAAASIVTAVVFTVIYNLEKNTLLQIQQNPAITCQGRLEDCLAKFDNAAFSLRVQANENLVPILWTFWGFSIALGSTSMILLFLPRSPPPPPNLSSHRSVLLFAP